MPKKNIQLVLIHGFAANKNIWGTFAEKLAQQYTVHCIDLPGYGTQTQVMAAHLSDLAQHVLTQVNPESSPQHFIWLGWSLGGLVAAYLAQTAPQYTQGLITLAFNPKFIADKDWPCGVRFSAFAMLEQMFKRKAEKALAQFYNLQGQGLDTLSEQQLQHFKEEVVSTPPQTLLRDLNLLATRDTRDIISELTCPWLNILGGKDPLVPISLIEQLKRLSAHAQNVTIEEAGHVMFLSHRAECLTPIHQFINESIIT